MTLVTKELIKLPNGSKSWTGSATYRELATVGSQKSWRTLTSYYVIEKVGNRWAKSTPGQIVAKTYTDTFSATWSESYDGDGVIKPSAYTLGRLYQGRYGKYNTIDNIQYNPIYW